MLAALKMKRTMISCSSLQRMRGRAPRLALLTAWLVAPFYPQLPSTQLPSTLVANDGADDRTASRSSFSFSWNDGRHLQLDAMD